MIKGITVTLWERTQTGADPFGRPVETEVPVQVQNVLPAPSTQEDIVSSLELYGRHAVYDLYLPKGDGHDWKNVRVDFFGQSFRTFGPVAGYVGANVPGPWNRRVRAEQYE